MNESTNLKAVKDGYKGILERGKRIEKECVFNHQN